MVAATDISTLRKAGRFEEALSVARAAFAVDPGDAYLQRAYGWVLYDLVKREVAAFEAKKIVPGRLAARFNEWLADYRKLDGVERPGMLHSLLLNQVLKGGGAWPGFLDFAWWWGPATLRDEDRQPYQTNDGKSLPSLEMRLAYAVGRAVVDGMARDDPERLRWGEQFLEEMLGRHPDDQWLHYYKSKLLIDRGEAGAARECLRPVVLRQRRAGWVWSLLGRTFEGEDPESAITCYFQAVRVAAQPQEVVNTRVRLAQLLAASERFSAAAVQVREALEFRMRSGYRIPQELALLQRADWYRELAGSTSLPAEPDVTEAADVLAFGKIQYRLGVVDNQNVDKKLAHVAFSVDEGVVLHYRRFKAIADVPVGSIIEVGHPEGDVHPSKWRSSAARGIEGFYAEVSGELSQRPGQAYGFLIGANGERVFMPPDLVDVLGGTAGAQVTCMAIMGRDKKHGTLGWRAICVAPRRVSSARVVDADASA